MIKLEKIAKSFKTDRGPREILRDVSLEIPEGNFVTLFGPNGCGKSTLMSIITGLDKSYGGKISCSYSKENIGFVFQDYRRSLFPWLNVAENILFPLKLRGIRKPERIERLKKLLRLADISLDLKQRVFNLSGGQAQTVSILRALIIEPKLLILDEPFSALDYERTLFLRLKIRQLSKKLGLTVLFVSHDLEEALFLGDSVVFLSKSPTIITNILDLPFGQERENTLIGTSQFAEYKLKALNIFEQNALINI